MINLEKKILNRRPFNRSEMAEKAQTIYERIRDELEAKYMGKVVAIEVDSGDYFIGETGLEACNKGKEKHPDKIFYGIRIGKRVYASYRSLGGGK